MSTIPTVPAGISINDIACNTGEGPLFNEPEFRHIEDVLPGPVGPVVLVSLAGTLINGFLERIPAIVIGRYG